ncbi:hypothetical protein ACU8DI_01800 [Psychroserpens sp. BH13MA-6]
MKKQSILLTSLLLICFVSFSSFKTSIQDKQLFEGVYDGHEDYGYNFIGVDDDDEEFTMTFQEVDADLLKSFDLMSDQHVGTKFSVTYTVTTETEIDEDGYEDDVDIYKIIALKKL